MKNAPEQRTVNVDVSDLDTRGKTVHGYAAVYGPLSEDLGGFRERIAPGAFKSVLDSDVRALLNHDPDQILGRTKSGTLRLEDDQRGLRFELDLPESPIGENVRAAVGRGDLDGASFRFLVGSETWDGDVRTVETVKELHDVTVATHPAYPDTSIELRTRPETQGDTMTEDTTEETEERTTLSTATLDQTTETRSIDEQLTEAILATRRGESRALTTAIDIAPTDVSSHLFDALRPTSVALQSGINVISTDRADVTFPLLTADVAPAWYAEAAEIVAGDPTLDVITATPHKLAHRVEFSNEVIDDSDPSALAVVQNNLLARMALGLDLGILEGTGQNDQPTGLANTLGTIGEATVGTPADLDVFATAITDLKAENANPGAIVMSPNIWAIVLKMKDANERYLLREDPATDAVGRIFNVPVYISNSIATNGGVGANESNIYIYDPSQVYLVRRTEVVVEIDRSRLFDTDQSEMRSKLRADVIVPNPKAVWVGGGAVGEPLAGSGS